MDGDVDVASAAIGVLFLAVVASVALVLAVVGGMAYLFGLGLFRLGRRLICGTTQERELKRVHRRRDRARRDIAALSSNAERRMKRAVAAPRGAGR